MSRPDTLHGPAVVTSGHDPAAAHAALVAQLAGARLYLCTDARRERGDLAEFLDAVLAGGVDIVQLRDKGLEARQELEVLDVVRAAARRHGALWSVNDRADVSHAAQAPVLHLGQDDLPVPLARAIIGAGPLVGRSSHAVHESEAALVEEGADYVAVGPCWPTPTKPGRPAPGLDLVRHIASWTAAQGISRPWFAIGGIDAERLDEVLEAGARRIVVVRALTEATDPHAAATDLARRLREAAGGGTITSGAPA